MNTLHTLNKAPSFTALFEQLMQTTQTGDAIILIENGCYYCLDSIINRRIQDIQVYALKDDLNARGIPYENSDANVIDYPEFVALCAQFDKVINWY